MKNRTSTILLLFGFTALAQAVWAEPDTGKFYIEYSLGSGYFYGTVNATHLAILTESRYKNSESL